MDDDQDQTAFASSNQSESLRFDPAQSFMISYGIDRQTSANYSHMGLGEPAASSAREVKKTFVDFGAIPEANAELFVASEQEEACTIAGMRRSFCQQARKAGKNGIFVLHFTGHGIKFKIWAK